MQYTKALLHFDDSNNIMKDEVSNNVWTKIGSPSISTSIKKFNSSLHITPGNWIQSSNKYMIGDQDFTFECFALIRDGTTTTVTNSGCATAISLGNSTTSEVGNRLLLGFSRGEFVCSVSGYSYWDRTGGAYTYNTWYHLAMSYEFSTNTFRFFVNGVNKGTLNPSTSGMSKSERWINIGVGSSRSTSYCQYQGNVNIDEVRLSIGICRYTANFTPPTQQFVYGPYVKFPSNYSGEYTTAPNKLKYYYKVKFEQGPYTTTSNVVNYETCQKLRLLMYLYKILIISIFLKTLKIRVVS